MPEFQEATFAGGCFWCTEAVFRRLKGVLSVKSGYSGGNTHDPGYEAVSEGSTGHAEVVHITFDPMTISYDTLLQVFWATHDPTTLNRQGNDVGTQYRSVIFYHNDEQKKKTEASREKMDKNVTTKVVTEILLFEKFYTAEEYHQNYYDRNQTYPYCSAIIAPKIKKLLDRFGDQVKEEYREQRE